MVIKLNLLVNSIAHCSDSKHQSSNLHDIAWNDPVPWEPMVIRLKMLYAKPVLLTIMLRLMNLVQPQWVNIVQVVLFLDKSNRKQPFTSFRILVHSNLVILRPLYIPTFDEVNVRQNDPSRVIVVKPIWVPLPGLSLDLHTTWDNAYKSSQVLYSASSSLTRLVLI